MQIRLFKPGRATALRWLNKVAEAPYSYEAVGASAGVFPGGFDHDCHTTRIGTSAHWDSASVAVRELRFFPGWTVAYAATSPLTPGCLVAVYFRLFGLWWGNAARVVYSLQGPDRFGFAYGTLRPHIESGEECFWIELDAEGQLQFGIKAFSRPRFWGARLLYPVARHFQRKFVRDAFQQMKSHCHAEVLVA